MIILDLLKQLELEQQYSERTYAKRVSTINMALSHNRATEATALSQLMDSISEMFIATTKELLSTKAIGQGAKYRAYLKRVDPTKLALITIRTVLGAAANPNEQRVTSVARAIGQSVEVEHMHEYLSKVNKNLVRYAMEKAKDNKNYSASMLRQVLTKCSDMLMVDYERWGVTTEFQVGMIMVRLFQESTGLIDWQLGECGSQVIVPTEELQKYINDMVDNPLGNTYYPPCIIKPNDWVLGGSPYYSEFYQRHSSLLSFQRLPKSYRRWVRDRLLDDTAAPLFKGLNHVQNVPFKVNKRVLDVLIKAQQGKIQHLGLPELKAAPEPVFPLNEDFKPSDASESELELFKDWKLRKRLWYVAEEKRKGSLSQLGSKLYELTLNQHHERMYFPSYLDWRGRVYYRSTLNPQGADFVKGCIDFADPKPLGERGLYWLKVHIANCCGYDKAHPDARVQWVDENWGGIEAFLNDPLNIPAPEPDTAFTLLQAGFALQEAMQLPDPTEYLCAVPVAMDATCSGLQHFSALLRDEVGGQFTNLTDINGEFKQDIYTQVASVAMNLFRGLCKDSALLQFWEERGIPRSMAKRPVMTYVYGSKLFSTIDYVIDDLRTSGIDEVVLGDKRYSLQNACIDIGKALRLSVEATVPSAVVGMRYLEDTVRCNDRAIRWVTPVGMPVINYKESSDVTASSVTLLVGGVKKRVKFALAYYTGEYSKRISTNGVAPNFIHSLDSSHLISTVLDLNEDIMVIHDSFGVHPCNVDKLHTSLRNTFVDMYKGDLLKDLLKGNILPDYQPSKGNLNLQDIRNSVYMFC